MLILLVFASVTVTSVFFLCYINWTFDELHKSLQAEIEHREKELKTELALLKATKEGVT